MAVYTGFTVYNIFGLSNCHTLQGGFRDGQVRSFFAVYIHDANEQVNLDTQNKACFDILLSRTSL